MEKYASHDQRGTFDGQSPGREAGKGKNQGNVEFRVWCTMDGESQPKLEGIFGTQIKRSLGSVLSEGRLVGNLHRKV